MTTLYLSHQHKAVKRRMLKTAEQHAQQAQDDLSASFPLPRYFQIHFQHIHERTDAVHQELAELKVQVQTLELKLDALLRLLVQQSKINTNS